MKHLIRSLGKGTDDTVSAVHLLISSLLEPHQQQQCKGQLTINLLSNYYVLCQCMERHNDAKNQVIGV